MILDSSAMSWSSLAIGVGSLLLLLLFKLVVSPALKQHLWPSMPMEIPVDILIVVAATIFSWGFDLPNPQGWISNDIRHVHTHMHTQICMHIHENSKYFPICLRLWCASGRIYSGWFSLSPDPKSQNMASAHTQRSPFGFCSFCYQHITG